MVDPKAPPSPVPVPHAAASRVVAPRVGFPRLTRPSRGASLGEVARPIPERGSPALRPPAGVQLGHGQGGARGEGAQSARHATVADGEPGGEVDPLDPLFRQHALLAPAASPAPAATPMAPLTPTVESTAPVQRARASLEEVLPTIVRKIAWSGDGRRGALRLEFGAGALAGSTLVVEADQGRVRVKLAAPPGVDAEGWRRRIGERLAALRIAVDSVDVE